jgi:hypothetical protein
MNENETRSVTQEIAITQCAPPPPQRGARAGVFIVGGQWSYYNALNALDYLPR